MEKCAVENENNKTEKSESNASNEPLNSTNAARDGKARLSDIKAKRNILFAAWLVPALLTMFLSLYDTVIMLRGGYTNTFATASGRNMFLLLAEGYECSFVYDLPVYIYITLALIVCAVLCAVYIPAMFRSGEKIFARAIEADNGERYLASARRAAFPWLPTVGLCVLMSAPEIACLITAMENKWNVVFLPNDNASFFVSVIVRLLIIGVTVAVSVISNRVVARPIYEEAATLYAEECRSEETDAESDDELEP